MRRASRARAGPGGAARHIQQRGERPVKSAVESLGPTRAKLTVEVPFEELKPSLDKAYKQIAQQINVPGFRKGKAPAAVIERQFPGAARDQALNDILNVKYVEALQANDLTPLAQPYREES